MKFLILIFLVNSSSGKIIRNEKLLPRFLTPDEKTRMNEIGNYLIKGPPPGVPVRTSAEYERVQCVFFRWPYSSWNSIWRDMIREVCEVAKAYIITEYSSDTSSIKSYLEQGGVNTDSVRFLITSTNSVWIRDYGPWNIYVENDTLSIVDLIYNRPRPQDDSFPSKLGQMWSLDVYLPDLTHPGGNFMVDGNGTGFSTDLIYEENSGMTPQEIAQTMKDYLGLDQFVTVPKIYYEYTGHIDIFAKILNDTLVMVGKYDDPNDPNYARLNEIADSISHVQNLDGKYFRVIRMVMPESFSPWNNTGATYLNSLFVNGKILVPIYNLPEDPEALQTYQQALPDYEIVGIDCQDMVGSGGAVHCVTMGFAPYDFIPSQIVHTPLQDTPISYWPLTVYSEVFDNLKVHRVYLTYNINHLDSTSLRMFNIVGTDSFQVQFSGNVNVGDSVFYRIFAIDGAFNKAYLPQNGYFAFEIKSAVEIAEKEKGNNLKIYFSNSNLFFSLPKPDNFKVDLYGVSGRKIKTLNLNLKRGTTRICFRDLKPGTYFVNLRSKNYMKKIKIFYFEGR